MSGDFFIGLWDIQGLSCAASTWGLLHMAKSGVVFKGFWDAKGLLRAVSRVDVVKGS